MYAVSTVARTVGANVRRLRRTRGLSLVDLGQHAGVAKGTLTQLEAGRGNPTLETIQALGRALGVTVRDLVTEEPDGAPLVVRAEGGTRTPGWPLDARLIHRSHTTGAITEFYGIRLPPGHSTRSPAHPYGVVEQVYVLSGTIEVGPVDACVTLGPNDFVHFNADRPHRYAAPDGEASALLLMIFPSFSVDTAPFRDERPAPTNGTTAPRVPKRGTPPQIPARGLRPPSRPPHGGSRRSKP